MSNPPGCNFNKASVGREREVKEVKEELERSDRPSPHFELKVYVDADSEDAPYQRERERERERPKEGYKYCFLSI